MEVMCISEAVEKWNLSHRRIQKLCSEGRIFGAQKVGNSWIIPRNTHKPIDGRTIRYKKIEQIPKIEYTSIDLFAGPGGLCTGLKWAGIKPLIAVEWSYWTVQTYSKSHDADVFELEKYLDGTMENPDKHFMPSSKTLLIYGDVNKVKNNLINEILNKRFGVDTVDIVTGGAPCESFSMAGTRKENDERNQLYQNILRIARAVDSSMFLFENVKGLFSKKLDGIKGEMYNVICNEFENKLEKPSYKLASTDKEIVLLKAVDYGVPQLRERIFLVGINNKYENVKYNYPEKTHGENKRYRYLNVKEAIMDLPQIQMGFENNYYEHNFIDEKDETTKYFLRRMRGDLSMIPKHIHFEEHSLFNNKAPGHTKKMIERMKAIKQGENMKTAFQRLNSEGKSDFTKVYFPRKIYAARNRRLRLNAPSFTATSHCLDEMIHPVLNRGLTPREVARIQSFPDWYQFQGPYVKFHSDPQQDQYEQIGDAIPPLLGYALGVEISVTLKKIRNQIS